MESVDEAKKVTVCPKNAKSRLIRSESMILAYAASQGTRSTKPALASLCFLSTIAETENPQRIHPSVKGGGGLQ